MNHSFEVAFYAECLGDDYDDYFAILEDMGVRHVGTGLSLAKIRDEHALNAIRTAADARGLSFVALHSPSGLLWEQGLEYGQQVTRDVIDAAATLGARSTVWHFRYIHLSKPEDLSGGDRVNTKSIDELDRLLEEALPPSCEYAKEAGVEINMENLPMFRWSRDSREILDLIRKVKLPNLGYIIDSGHSHANGEDPAAMIREAGPLLRDTHLHDNLGVRGFDFSQPGTQADITPARDLHMVPGQGTINWIDLVRALRDIKYTFAITFEGPRMRGHPDEQSIESWERCMRLTLQNWRMFEETAEHLPDP
ncbi:MAG: sugar phosphate isomerase/epimerase family protein [Planctomycetota bacterium]|jgi:sugar phosphate isomerase/epimerase|nr:sugar phosphate isomerase/epimerase family protein [Planctomycetota bacterium]MDP7133257.1 sugar phosphate isomerase/epimerase family protein [Planctomycetota bacterium]MDP7251996.1 sugar phosphate isomerase/epimerase family protein [Planctomycetota bacterium]